MAGSIRNATPSHLPVCPLMTPPLPFTCHPPWTSITLIYSYHLPQTPFLASLSFPTLPFPLPLLPNLAIQILTSQPSLQASLSFLSLTFPLQLQSSSLSHLSQHHCPFHAFSSSWSLPSPKPYFSSSQHLPDRQEQVEALWSLSNITPSSSTVSTMCLKGLATITLPVSLLSALLLLRERSEGKETVRTSPHICSCQYCHVILLHEWNSTSLWGWHSKSKCTGSDGFRQWQSSGFHYC